MTIPELYKLWIEQQLDICTDSRNIRSNGLFFALRGPHFNANRFASQALKDGAFAVVVDDPTLKDLKQHIWVSDVLTTLQDLARYHRQQMPATVIALTGSNGKTTNKELIREVLQCRYVVLATEGNLNNHIGVPLTLLKLKQEHEIAIIEMGANHQGEIAMLSAIAEPNLGLITNIGKAHLEGFGGIEGVLKGKTELYRFLKNSGARVFVNADDPKLMQSSEGMLRTSYGISAEADVQMIKVNPHADFCRIELCKPSVCTIQSQLIGTYNAYNLLTAVTVGLHFNIPIDAIAQSIAAYNPQMNRSQEIKTMHNVLIMDAYNANPSSMQAALEHLFINYKPEQLAIVLGDMYELGDSSADEHQKIVDWLQLKRASNVFLVGHFFERTTSASFMHFKNITDLENHLKLHPIIGMRLLLKGSRAMHLERLKPLL